jgi:hypothetical protein
MLRIVALGLLLEPEELANFVFITGIAHAADLEFLAVGELKLAAAGVHGGADAATLAEQLGDCRGVLLHVAAADEARQHLGIKSAIAADDTPSTAPSFH